MLLSIKLYFACMAFAYFSGRSIASEECSASMRSPWRTLRVDPRVLHRVHLRDTGLTVHPARYTNYSDPHMSPAQYCLIYLKHVVLCSQYGFSHQTTLSTRTVIDQIFHDKIEFTFKPEFPSKGF